jgi:UPF0716 protein FxsA
MRPPFAARLAFVALVVAELAVIVLLANWLGAWAVFWLMLATSLLGGWVVRNEGVRAWTAVAEAVRAGRAPERDLAASRAAITGGFLLILPGFVTDLIGAALAVPATRAAASRVVARVRLTPDSWSGIPGRNAEPPGTPPPSGEVIEGEIIDPEEPDNGTNRA